MKEFTPVEYVDASGKPWAPSIESLQSRPKAKRERPAEWHKGWVVVGHKPGECEAARRERESQLREWASMTDDARKKAIKDGLREPKPWDEDQWRLRAKKHFGRSRPFEIPAAADDMSALLRRAGWEDVEIIEQAKRK